MSGTLTPDPFVGAIIDERYRVEELVARGGMATVYRATDLRLSRTVALKVLAGTLAQDSAFVDRFVHEARATASLQHPNVVAVHDTGVHNGFPFIVMEFVPGRTIREVLQQNGPLTPAHALEIMRAVLAGLSAAHDGGFVHRDIKPENVLITSDGHIKVTDFGLARVISEQPISQTTGGVLLGTMAYLAPEQVQQLPVDQRCDVYAAGILLFELVTGRVPYVGSTPLEVAYRHVNEDVPAPSTFQPDIPPAIDHLVLGATRRNVNDRIQSARIFADGVARAQVAVPAAEALSMALPSNSDTMVIPAVRDNTARQTAVGTGAHRATTTTARRTKGRKPADPKRRRRRLAVVLLVALLGVGAYFVNAGNSQTVPDVVNQTADAAQKVLTDAGIPSDVTTGFSESVAKGSVISTDPKAGAKIHKGSRLSVVISAGPERFIIPSDLAGKDVTTATAELKDLTLVVAGTQAVFNEKITLGLVVTSNPLPGAKVKRGAEVTLIISKGPKPVPVPAIVGQSTAEATVALKAVGLDLAVTERIYDNSAKGTVIKSTPAPGTTVPKGTVINVTVSNGPPLVAVPNVVGMTKSAATQTLTDAGFKVATQSAFGGNRYVASQSPAAGTKLVRGATVTIILVL